MTLLELSRHLPATVFALAFLWCVVQINRMSVESAMEKLGLGQERKPDKFR